MFNDAVEAEFFENLDGESIAEKISKRSIHRLYFKQNAYNWICVSTNPPPSFDLHDRRIPQTQIADIALSTEEIMRIMLLLLSGRLFFAYWLVYADEFHVTKETFESFPFPFSILDALDQQRLIELSSSFEERLPETIQYKLNAGKRVGTYNTAKLWHLTDQSDEIFLKYLTNDPKRVFESIQRHVAETIKTVTDNSSED